MEFFARGLSSTYEAEHVARLFFPRLTMAKRRPGKSSEAVWVTQTKQWLWCAVRCPQGKAFQKQRYTSETDVEYEVCRMLFSLLCDVTGNTPPWGMLTGVRPVRLLHDLRKKGMSDEQLDDFFLRRHFVLPEKLALAKEIEQNQAPVRAMTTPRSVSVYISIPFCPSRCSYCSFVSRTTEQSRALMEPYVDCLLLEIAQTAKLIETLHLKLETIYIGGGTPTAVTAAQLRRVMQAVKDQFDLSKVREYTVEAGRPDCTDEEKLGMIYELGATRISINPQTLSDRVLAAIGRRHTAQDILDCFAAARRVGHRNINMDLIAGLPQDTVKGFEESLRGVAALQPENITVHTLTMKRASNLVIDGAESPEADVARMLEACAALAEQDYAPYYLYRQKGTLQNLENTGYCKPGFTGLYNVFIMEELHTILSVGAGGSTKLVAPGGHIERIFNFKYPTEYVNDFARITEKKEGVNAFYGKYFNLDSETVG